MHVSKKRFYKFSEKNGTLWGLTADFFEVDLFLLRDLVLRTKQFLRAIKNFRITVYKTVKYVNFAILWVYSKRMGGVIYYINLLKPKYAAKVFLKSVIQLMNELYHMILKKSSTFYKDIFKLKNHFIMKYAY